MKKINTILISSLLIITLASCSNNTPTNYSEKKVNAYYKNEDLTQEANLRFYEQTKDIPYIEINDYYNLLLKDTPLAGKNLEINKNNNIYEIKTKRGGIAYYDASNNTFESPNFALFNNTDYFDLTTNGVTSFDGMPWIKVKEIKYDKSPSKFKIDFDDYNIKIFNDSNKIYFPVQTINDLFSNMNLLAMSYNLKDLYIVNGTNEEKISDFEYYHLPMLENEISSTYAEYNYNEICLNYDNLLGRPNRSSYSKYYDTSLKLNDALAKKDLGKRIIELIKSPIKKEYLAGTTLLGHILADGGHTNFLQANYISSLSSISNDAKTLLEDVLKVYRPETEKNYEELIKSDITVAMQSAVRVARAEKLGKQKTTSNLVGEASYTLSESKKTAIISVDGFMDEMYQRSLWDAYYSGKRDKIPFGTEDDKILGGAVGNIYYGLNKANEDNVENIIIDLASNTGGSTDELMYLVYALTGCNYLKIYNYTTSNTSTVYFDIDVNLDKKFDDQDKPLIGDKTLSIILSQNGFSCGGISPIYLHDLGAYSMGDISGGGSCAIYYNYDAYGLPYVNSCPYQIISPKGTQIDEARFTSCDLELGVIKDSSGNKIGLDYKEFYDLNKLESYINNHNKK